MKVWVTVSGAQGTRAFAVDMRTQLQIGRDERCEVRLHGHLVSRRHAVVSVCAESLEVRDQSTNGTLIDGVPLHRAASQVAWGTPLAIGGELVVIRRESPADMNRRNQLASNANRENAGAGGPGDVSGREPQAAAQARASAAAAAKLRRQIHRRLIENLDLSKLDPTKPEDPALRPRVEQALTRIVAECDESFPPGTERGALVRELTDEALGLGPLEAMLADPKVSEIMVVDPHTIYVEREGQLCRTEARFTDEERVRAVIERIVAPLGRRVDEASPLVDARLPGGERVNVVTRPLALKGSCLTIRRFCNAPASLAKLQALGSLSAPMARFLTRCVIARKNVLVSGGTSSGKTTLLNVLSSAIPRHERIITIEDAAELSLHQPHVVALETRPPNLEGKGAFRTRDLVRNAMRMRPDRIIVGECRGGEALDMLQAMNTGHDGSLTTIHANSAMEAISRLETLALMADVGLPARAIREQIAQSLHVIVQQQRFSDGSRRVSDISEVVGMEEHGGVELRPVFRFVRTGQAPDGATQGEFLSTGYLPSFLGDFATSGLVPEGESFL